jgi:L-ascorbate metabolism protein UlaG (beta-lactamase superfamily)
LGGLHRVLTESEIEKLGTIDILLLPVGGGELLDSKRAVEVMNAIEPRLVIPLAHQVEGLKEELGTADSFCKQVGVCTRTDGNKLKISRKDLPSDTVTVAVLERA